MTSVADVTFALLREAWSALGGGTDLLALVDLTGDGAGLLPSTLPAMVAGVPADYTDMLRLLAETVAAGHSSRPNNDVESVIGAPPTSFADFVRRSTNHWIGH
jgi:hypothetical protein